MLKPLALVLSAAACLSAQAPQLTYADLLRRVVEPDWLWQPPPAGERCVQFSSYDRSSDKGPGDHAAWYGNGDRGQYLRVDERDGHKEYVMVDCDGPGCIARIWSANPKGKLFFDVDGQRVWEVDFAAFSKGQLDGLGEPWCGERARGCNSHLPIPFQRHLRVAASDGDFYYQVNVVRFAPGTQVPGFSAQLLQQQQENIAAAGKRLAGRAARGWMSSVGMTTESVPPGSVVESIEVRVVGRPEGVDLGQALRDTRLVVRCGRETTVDVPVLDFFNGGPDWKPHRGFLLGVDENGGYCDWPMPMPNGGSVALTAEGEGKKLELTLSTAIRLAPEQVANALLFRANWHLVKNDHTRPYHDHLVLDAKGQGRFCGTSLLVKNPTKGWWGEGDEKFWVDGESFPSTFGTGTEDYFGYAWCSPQPFSAAFHAQPQCDGPGNYGFSAVNRMQVLDSVPFQRSFRFDLEVWHWVVCNVDYATVAYWYGAPGASAGLPPLPDLDQRKLDRLPPYRPHKIANAIEAEALAVQSCSGGTHQVQELDDEKFSDGKQRWWMDGKPGDQLSLALPVPAAGRYRVRAQFCTAADYGIVQVHLGGKKLGAPIDLFHRGIRPSGLRELGTVELPAGDATLVLELTGRNEQAVPRLMVGLDCLLLEPVQ